MTPERQWQITENLKLAREYIREYLEDPRAFADFIDGRTIVLLPADAKDASRLTYANLRMAHHLAQSGRDVVTYEIGTLATRRPVYLTSRRDRS